MVAPRVILDIVQIVFYTPALVFAIYCAMKHGFNRQHGWVYLIVLSLLRLIGSGTGIASHDYPSNMGLLECTIICATVGLSPLLLVIHAILQRVHAGMTHPPVSTRVMRAIYLPILIALILAIVGGTDLFSTNPSTVNSGHTYVRAGVTIFAFALAILTIILLLTLVHIQRVMSGDRRLVIAGLAAIPFLIVRLIYSLISAWDYTNSSFSLIGTSDKAVIIQAIMAVLMEFIVVTILLAAGLMTDKIPQGQAPSEEYSMVDSSQSQHTASRG